MKAFRALSSGLSNISIYLDVPLHVYQVDATELSTSTSLISILTPFPVTPLVAVPVETMGSDFRLYASLYREATGSNSPSYQFLCYFKIIEGIRVRHQRRASEAHARGAPIPSSPPEYIPAGPEGQRTWLASLFPLKQEWDEIALAEVFPQEAVGRKLNDVVDKELDGIRNKIAHAILRSGEPTALIDDGHDGLLINKWLPLTKCIARAQLRNEFQEVFRRGVAARPATSRRSLWLARNHLRPVRRPTCSVVARSREAARRALGRSRSRLAFASPAPKSTEYRTAPARGELRRAGRSRRPLRSPRAGRAATFPCPSRAAAKGRLPITRRPRLFVCARAIRARRPLRPARPPARRPQRCEALRLSPPLA